MSSTSQNDVPSPVDLKDQSACESQKKTPDPEENAPDGAYGWLVVTAALLVMGVVYGIPNGFTSFIYKELLADFDTDKPTASWVASLQYSLLFLTGSYAGGLVKNVGCRSVGIAGGVLLCLGFGLSAVVNSVGTLFITLSLVTGTGLGLLNIATFSIIQYYFNRKQALANGIATCGSGVGTVVVPIISAKLIDHLGWQRASLVYGGATGLLCCTCAALFIPLARERRNFRPFFQRHGHSINKLADFSVVMAATIGIAPSKSTCKKIQESKMNSFKRFLFDLRDFVARLFTLSEIRDLSIVLYSVCWFFIVIGIQVSVQFIPARAIERGLSNDEAAYLLSILGGTAIFGRLFAGVVATAPRMRGLNTLYFFSALNLISGIDQFMSPVLTSFGHLAIASAVFGFTYGGTTALFIALVRHIAGLDRFSSAVSVVFTATGLGPLISGPIAGSLYETFQTYDGPYIFTGCCFVMSVFFSGMILIFKRGAQMCCTDNNRHNSESVVSNNETECAYQYENEAMQEDEYPEMNIK